MWRVDRRSEGDPISRMLKDVIMRDIYAEEHACAPSSAALGWRRDGGDFHGQPVTPAIFAYSNGRDLLPQLTVALAVKDPCHRVDARCLDPDHNFRIAPNV